MVNDYQGGSNSPGTGRRDGISWRDGGSNRDGDVSADILLQPDSLPKGRSNVAEEGGLNASVAVKEPRQYDCHDSGGRGTHASWEDEIPHSHHQPEEQQQQHFDAKEVHDNKNRLSKHRDYHDDQELLPKSPPGEGPTGCKLPDDAPVYGNRIRRSDPSGPFLFSPPPRQPRGEMRSDEIAGNTISDELSVGGSEFAQGKPNVFPQAQGADPQEYTQEPILRDADTSYSSPGHPREREEDNFFVIPATSEERNDVSKKMTVPAVTPPFSSALVSEQQRNDLPAHLPLTPKVPVQPVSLLRGDAEIDIVIAPPKPKYRAPVLLIVETGKPPKDHNGGPRKPDLRGNRGSSSSSRNSAKPPRKEMLGGNTDGTGLVVVAESGLPSTDGSTPSNKNSPRVPPPLSSRGGDTKSERAPSIAAPPKLPVFRKIVRPSNMKMVKNALVNVCLAGMTMAKIKDGALAALKQEADRGERNFVILLRNTRALNYHGMYSLDLQQHVLTKFHGMGPSRIGLSALAAVEAGGGEVSSTVATGEDAATIDRGASVPMFDPKNIDKYLKYDSGNKQFKPLSTRTLSMAVDAVAICPTKLKSLRRERH
jgi:hypothetical protein